jgi:hypothetical protein
MKERRLNVGATDCDAAVLVLNPAPPQPTAHSSRLLGRYTWDGRELCVVWPLWDDRGTKHTNTKRLYKNTGIK